MLITWLCGSLNTGPTPKPTMPSSSHATGGFGLVVPRYGATFRPKRKVTCRMCMLHAHEHLDKIGGHKLGGKVVTK